MFAVAVGATVLWEPRLEKPPLPVSAVVCCLLAKPAGVIASLVVEHSRATVPSRKLRLAAGRGDSHPAAPSAARLSRGVKHPCEHSWEWDVISAMLLKSAFQTSL